MTFTALTFLQHIHELSLYQEKNSVRLQAVTTQTSNKRYFEMSEVETKLRYIINHACKQKHIVQIHLAAK